MRFDPCSNAQGINHPQATVGKESEVRVIIILSRGSLCQPATIKVSLL